jgi:hypothetical protein
VAEINGKYYDEEQNQVRSSEASYDQEALERLWEMSEEKTDFEYPV